MNFGRAFSFVFQDNDWIKKVLIGGLVSLIPIVGNFITTGYVLEVTRNTYEGNDSPMPEWHDLGGYLVRGFLLVVGVFIWMLPLYILIACAVAVTVLAFAGSDALGWLTVIADFCLFLILILIWSIAFVPMVTARYAVERQFGEMMNFRAVIQDARNAGGALIILFAIALVAGLIAWVGFLACFIGVIFTSFFANLVVGQAIGQTYQVARGVPDPGSQAAF